MLPEDVPISSPVRVERHFSLSQAATTFFPMGPITVSSLRRAVRNGDLMSVRVGRKILVTESLLAEWLNRCRASGNRPTSPERSHLRAPWSGSSEMERSAKAQAAASALMTKERNGS